MEIELQYLYRSEDQLLVPAELAGFVLAQSLSFEIVDRFFDAHDLQLRLAGSSVRVRQQSNLPRPILTWKGPSERRDDGARQREEVEVPIDHVPTTGEELVHALRHYSLWETILETSGLNGELELEPIGQIQNRRTTHLFVQGLHRLEMAWDRITYPVGRPEVRLEVEAKRQAAARYLGEVDRQLRGVYGKTLVPAPHGKAKEMCTRLYPEVFAAAR
jgi:inorganic triphosphatase YgiF